MPTNRRGNSAITKAYTPLLQRFAEEYLVDLNGTQAMLRAGYNGVAEGAATEASRALKHPKVQLKLSSSRRELSRRIAVSQERVLTELARHGFSDIRRFVRPDGQLIPLVELSEAEAAAVSEYTVKQVGTELDGDGNPQPIYETKIKLVPKGPALDGLAKHLGLYADAGPAGIKGSAPDNLEGTPPARRVAMWMLHKMREEQERGAKPGSHVLPNPSEPPAEPQSPAATEAQTL